MSGLFELRGVSKRFGTERALDNVSISGQSGSVIALLGENGAGKTTAIRILLGLLEPEGGSSSVFGLDSWEHGNLIRRRVGYMPDKPTLYEWMTVDEIGWFCGGFYDRDFAPNYRKLVNDFGLPLNKKISTLSKGMKAKVAMSLSMAHRPDLLVLDEPTSGLDPIVRREVMESMVDVAAQNRTVLLSSHQLGEVERVADVIAIVKRGKLALVAKMDVLKSEVRELVITMKNGVTTLPTVPAEVMHSLQLDRQWRLLVRFLDESKIEDLRAETNVGQVEIRHPSLEDIYVGVMQGEATPGSEDVFHRDPL